MKRRHFFILLCLFGPSAFAQNISLIDSLKNDLRGATGEARYKLLNDLAWEFRFAYPDSTIFYSQEAYNFARSLDVKKDLARGINFVGIAYNYKGERLKAFDYFTQAIRISTEQQDSFQIAHSHNNMGRLFYEQGVLSKSYDHFVKASELFQALNDSSGLAYTHQSLANLYKTQRDYTKAEDNFLLAYRIRLALGNSRDIMSAMLYLGRLYQETRQLEQSIRYLKLADSTGHVINDEINLAEIKTYLAESYLGVGLLDEAQRICSEGLSVIVLKNNVRMMPQAYHTMGQIFFMRNDFGAAKRYFLLSLDFANRMKDLNAKMDAYYYLWKVSEKQNNRQEGTIHHNQYLVLKDSIKDLDLARQVERMQFQIQIERKEQENNLLKETEAKNFAIIQQQRLQNIILIVIIAFVSIVGGLQWLNAKKRRTINVKLLQQNNEIQLQREEIVRQNEKLSKRNQQLSDLNLEKDTLMSIVAHDLKSPLHRISGLTQLMQQGHPDKELQGYLMMVKDATHAGLNLITDLLDVHMLEENVEPNYSVFDVSKFLLDKTEAFMPNAKAKNIHLHITRVENEEVFCDRDYLDRIFDNLLSNSIKFSPRNSIVDISADRSEFEFWISVKDRGPGFSTEDRAKLFQKFRKLSARPTGGETSNGLGLAIVKILVDRLKGSIELTSEPGKGSEFVVRFPQPKQYA